MRRVMFLLIAMLAAAPASRAEDCATASDQSTMNECAGRAWKQADATLNALYGQIRGRLAGDARTLVLLTSAQRAWVAYRDAECDFGAAGVTGGSLYPMIHLACAEGLTRARIKDLRAYLNCQEGDLGCPVPSK